MTLAGCSRAPTLKKLDPADGHPHDVIFVEGADRDLAQIVWDAGMPGERIIPGPFLGAFMFSVPHGAGPGAHNVALQNNAGRSAPVIFTVPSTPGLLTVARPPGPATRAFPEPRIDAVTVLGATFDSSGVSVSLYVQGANIDVGATVWLEDTATAMLTEVATVSHKAIRNDWLGVSSDELDYPIYHYSSAIVTLGVRSPGEEIRLVVKNLDGTPSNKAFEYKLPSDADSIDSDGDGLLDKWETSGYDYNADGVVDIDLPGLGADPYRRDLFVELDIMDGVKYRPDLGKDGASDSTVFDALRAMFESAPVINVKGPPGIHLEIDASGKPCLADPTGVEKCSFEFTMFDTSPPTVAPDPFTTGKARFSKLKEHSFNNDLRGKVYHYAIWGIQDDNDHDSGHSDFADDFLISFDAFDPPYQTRRSQVEMLAHELGHDLGQRHGGSDDELYRPNYLSVMSYNWALRTGWADDGDRKAYVTCLPFYYASPKAQEVDGAVPKNVNTIVDYSEGMARTLVRPPTAGSTDLCGLPVDWTTISDVRIITTSEDFPNWRDLKFDGPVRNGWIAP